MADDNKPIDKRLIGEWIVDATDAIALQHIGDVQMNFYDNNVLRYLTKEKNTFNITMLTWWVEDDYIITQQSDKQQLEKTKYQFEGTSKLNLEFERLKTRFIKNLETL
jgi:hypothetical protein